MTYKRADRPGWPRLRAQRFICQRIADGRVNGYATLLRMLEVAEPLWVMHHDQRICIADNGYAWLQLFPEGASYTHTTMFDADGQPVQEYIDLVAEQGVGEDGIPWYDDLYLDIAWIPEGTPILLDQEELEAAHAIGAVTEEQYELARGETARLLVAVALGDYTLPEVTRACYPALKAALEVAEISGEAPLPVVTLAESVEAASDQETPAGIVEIAEIADDVTATDSVEQSEQSEPAAQPVEDGEQDA
ncbi:MAG TPA: DUF402 domain-containing protein [Ktedonobacterales bacterium]|jgi:hypothetical protein